MKDLLEILSQKILPIGSVFGPNGDCCKPVSGSAWLAQVLSHQALALPPPSSKKKGLTQI